jgi:hypothetical protein
MDDLGDFFSVIGEVKKKEKEKTKDIVGEISLGDLFTSLKEEKKREKQKQKEKQKELDKVKKDAKIFENIFFDKPQEPVKTDDWKQNYTPTEVESVDIVSPEPLQPSPGAEKFEEEIAELEQEQEELSENVERWKDNLDVLVPKEEIISEEENDVNRLGRELDVLRKMVYETIQKVEVQGGGGETRLQYLDDIAGITTNINAFDGLALKIDLNQTGEDKHKLFKFGNVGAAGTWAIDSVGIHTVKSVGINTTSAVTDKSLYVDGDVQFTGSLGVGGTITYEDVTNIDSVGLITARSGILVGSGITLSPEGNGFFVGVVTATSFFGNLIGNADTATNSIQLNSQAASHYLDYNNFTNTPTIPTNNNELTNGAGFITTSFTNTNQLVNGAGFITTSFTNTNQLVNGAGFITDVVTGVLTATSFSGDGSNLTGIANTHNVSTNTLNVIGVSTFIGQLNGGNATFSGNVTIGGTVTYEDVTNIDSVGIITARKGIVSLGIVTSLGFDGNVTAGVVTATTLLGDGSGMTGIVTNIIAGSNISVNSGQGQVTITGLANTSNVSTNTLVVSGISTLGIVTGATSVQATKFYGDGSSLTGINAGAGGTENVSSSTITAGIITATSEFYPPTLTTAQRDTISFTNGAMIFNTSDQKVQLYLGGGWKTLAFELDTYSVVGL